MTTETDNLRKELVGMTKEEVWDFIKTFKEQVFDNMTGDEKRDLLSKKIDSLTKRFQDFEWVVNR